ncbi:hypothetical protein [Cuniculiplasma divulgatum]|uniref:hypothetical protein n=1 Tax=Cuniculiplasma divulgatum TaxID=1673428 RepID=UPI0011AE9A15|nr:hypothetical protein [Cuniculiplasma divulgatum]MCI2412094.1 hypothetical protein [Cuniculiplasma sp.]WMT48702.1 MAG: hypothetical protein RE472_06390 [Thermoplasmatales archaeon]
MKFKIDRGKKKLNRNNSYFPLTYGNILQCNIPDPYFYYGCYQPSSMFSERFNLSVGYNDPSTMDHFTYGENFVLINTTLTGNVCEERETYSGSFTSPAYLLFG